MLVCSISLSYIVSIAILSHVYSQNVPTVWTQSNTPLHSYVSLASDSSGSILGATDSTYDTGHVWLSTGSNPTSWSATNCPTSSESWYTIVMSDSGQYIAVGSAIYDPDASGNIYLSKNYGVEWETTSASGNQAYSALAMDSTGQYIYATANTCCNAGNIYYSHDSGSEWSSVSGMGGLNWQSVSCNSNGTFVAAVANNAGTGVYLSYNYGVSYTVSSAPLAQYSSVSMSSNSLYICAAQVSGMYCSQTAGIIWFPVVSSYSNSEWKQVFISGTASIIYALNAGNIVYSVDYGNSWSSVSNFPNDQYCHALTADDAGSLVAVSCYPYSAPQNKNSTIWIGNSLSSISSSSSDSSLTSGEVAGITIGIAAFAMVVIGVGIFFYLRIDIFGAFENQKSSQSPVIINNEISSNVEINASQISSTGNPSTTVNPMV
jgi:hypothetical protein